MRSVKSGEWSQNEKLGDDTDRSNPLKAEYCFEGCYPCDLPTLDLVPGGISALGG